MIHNIVQVQTKLGHYKGLDTEKFSYATGNDGDEDSIDLEDSDISDVGGVESADLPRFRELVRAKKSEYKNKFGKSHHVGKKKDCATTNGLTDAGYIALLPTSALTNSKHCIGWRTYWKAFKKNGGLNQLKALAKGKLDEPLTEEIDNTVKGAIDTNTDTSTPTNYTKVAIIGSVVIAVIVGSIYFFKTLKS